MDRGKTGKLTIVPTPIGNLGDITLRALDALRSADVVYAEDTRVTGKLLRALDIGGASLRRLDENTMNSRAARVVDEVSAGAMVAYCTDAGMPGVSDPGLRLVATARAAGVPVEVLPGPSAAPTAYVTSGTTCPRYYFGGFFPRKPSEQVALLSQLAALQAALVFYESPHRLSAALAVIARAYPHREVAVCRELTKLHEEIVRANAGDLAQRFALPVDAPNGVPADGRDAGSAEAPAGMPIGAPAAVLDGASANVSARALAKGEVVIVIDPPAPEEASAAQADAADEARTLARMLVSDDVPQKQIVRTLVDKCGVSRNEAYEITLAAKGRA